MRKKVAVLIPGEIEFKSTTVIGNYESHYTKVKG